MQETLMQRGATWVGPEKKHVFVRGMMVHVKKKKKYDAMKMSRIFVTEIQGLHICKPTNKT